MENQIFSVVVTNVLPSYGEVLSEATTQVERSHRAELAQLQIEADKLQAANLKLDHDVLQQCIMMEKSFSGSEGGLDISAHSERSVIQRMLTEEMSFSNSDNSQELICPARCVRTSSLQTLGWRTTTRRSWSVYWLSLGSKGSRIRPSFTSGTVVWADLDVVTGK